jgi:prephenate dehydrogenase
MTHDEAHDELQYWTRYKQEYSHMSAQSHATVDNRINHLEHIVSTTLSDTDNKVDMDMVYGWGIVFIGLTIVVVSCLI